METNNFNVVGDVAGNFKTLQALLAKMPQDAELICLGDPMDRGPRSKEVIEFLMKNGRTLQSNHAHMMTTEWHQHATPGAIPRYYEEGIWYSNGGIQTMHSYTDGEDWNNDISRFVPKAHIDFLENCPMHIWSENYLFTHAPCRQNGNVMEMCKLGDGFASRMRYDWYSDNSLLWNRFVPERPNPQLNGSLNIFGHNAAYWPKVFTPKFPNGIMVKDTEELKPHLEDAWALCIDTARKNKSGTTRLTGLHVPTMTLYNQEYID